MPTWENSQAAQALSISRMETLSGPQGDKGLIAIISVEVPYHGLEILVQDVADDVRREDKVAAVVRCQEFDVGSIASVGRVGMNGSIGIVCSEGVGALECLSKTVGVCARLKFALKSTGEVSLEAVSIGWEGRGRRDCQTKKAPCRPACTPSRRSRQARRGGAQSTNARRRRAG
jgi:hypothetical protein